MTYATYQDAIDELRRHASELSRMQDDTHGTIARMVRITLDAAYHLEQTRDNALAAAWRQSA